MQVWERYSDDDHNSLTGGMPNVPSRLTAVLFLVSAQSFLLLAFVHNPRNRRSSYTRTGISVQHPQQLQPALAIANNKMAEDDGWETVPTASKKADKRRDRKEGKASGVLPWVSFIPPTDASSNFEPFMLLLSGIPGSGKSTFATSLQTAMPYKYVRINQDELGNRQRCEELARATLANQQCPIIDRCNFDKSQRANFIAIAVEFGVPVDCIVLGVDTLVTVDECIQRCQKRRNHPGLSPQEARGVVLQMARQMNPPSAQGDQEGIRSVHHITNSNMFNDTLVSYMNKR